MENKANDQTVRDLSARIRQLNSMVTLAKDLPFSRQKDFKDLIGSLMLNVGSRTLPAEANVKLSENIDSLERFIQEEEQRGKDFGHLKAAIWEPFTIKAS